MKKRLSVCILTTTFPLRKGSGPGFHILKQVRHLKNLGLHVSVLAPHHLGSLKEEIIDDIQIFRIKYMWPERFQKLCYGTGIQANLKKYFLSRFQIPVLVMAFFLKTLKIARKCDLIHAHWSLAGLAGVLAGKILRKPVVLMMHHAKVNMFGVRWLIRFTLEHADIVLCNSGFTKSKILEISSPKACEIVYIGVDSEQFHPDLDTSSFYQIRPDIQKNRPLILATGRFVELKGFKYLLDAIALIDLNPKPLLMLVGYGPLEKQLRARAINKGIADRVKFLGYIHNDKIPIYYAAADIIVVPSIIDDQGETEALGLVLLEAYSSGKPIIASNVGGIPEIVINGVNGFLIKPKNTEVLANKIKELVADHELRKEMGKQGRLMIEKKYSWHVRSSKTVQIYENILS